MEEKNIIAAAPSKKGKQKKDNTEFIELLNSRLKLAKKHSKKWVDEVKKWIKSYEIDGLDDIQGEDLHNKLQIPYIFSTVESAQPSMFNSFPQLIIKGRGKDDQEFGDFVSNTWEYIYDKTSFEEKIENAGTMFLITGIGQAGTGWVVETEKVEEQEEKALVDPTTGQPMLDPESGEPMTEMVTNTYEVPVKDMPVIEFKDYRKIFYSPESEFVIDDIDGKIPYIFEEIKMSPEDIKEKYGVSVDDKTYMDLKEISSDLDVDDKDIVKDDIKRTSVYVYQGILPKKHADDEDWKPGRTYVLTFACGKILEGPKRIQKKTIFQVGNYGVPTKFFKFGEPKILKDLEEDISLGRSTLIDYRDKFANKVAIPSETEVDEKALKSPKKFAIVRYGGNNPPSYMTPPPIPETVIMGIDQSKADIAMTSAQLDVGRGGDSSTVDTATGQKIFQQAQSERIERKRRKIAKFIQAIARSLLLDCANKWDIETFAKIHDKDPNDETLIQYVERLKGIGDFFDIEIEPESVVDNKATQGAQAIAMYREMKDDPLVNREELIREAIKTGFQRKNVDRFLSQQIPPETIAKVAEMFAQQGIMDPNVAQQIIAQTQQQAPGNPVGRPPSADAATIMKNSMPGTDETQIQAQTEAAPQQTGVSRGPQI